jgi:hypothetical protein
MLATYRCDEISVTAFNNFSTAVQPIKKKVNLHHLPIPLLLSLKPIFVSILFPFPSLTRLDARVFQVADSYVEDFGKTTSELLATGMFALSRPWLHASELHANALVFRVASQ